MIVRDFGRVLRSGRMGRSGSPLGRYPTMVLTGNSATAWFVNTFLAEGFNADPDGRRVYQGALVVTGAGNWLAINQLGDDGEPQQPYVRLNGRPLPASKILTRSDTDPFYVDVVSYTEFYRLRAALARDPDPPGRTRRYELQQRYGSVAEYERRADPLIDRLVQQGLLLRADRQWVVEELRGRFTASP